MLNFYRAFVGITLNLFLVLSLSAFKWVDLWSTKDQQGTKAFADGKFSEAAEQFDSAQWRASSNYRAGEYAKAIKDFQSNKSAQGFYNLGNAQAKAGQLKQALVSYNQALKKQPFLPDAEFNRELVKNLLEQQNNQQEDQQKDENKQGQQQQQANNQNSQNENNKDAENKSTETNNESEQSNEKQQQAQNQNSDSESEQSQQANNSEQQDQQKQGQKNKEKNLANNEQEKSSEEKAKQDKRTELADLQPASLGEKEQADMQWMQQIVDDPGGLLRRKFLRDYQRRHLERR